MNAAVYSGTRNIYSEMLTAAKSLLIHSNVNKIYFLIEDDNFPYELPPEIECINVSNQTFFPITGPNFKTACTYMVLLRAAYTKIFPQLDKILTIDMDTVVNENVSDLWEIDLTDYYLAAVEERDLSEKEGSYINMGVAMLNLKKLREDGIDDKMIYALNNFWYRYGEQDCFNEFCRGKVKILSSDYNACIQAAPPKHEKITHFAGLYKLGKFPNFDYYKNMNLPTERNLYDRITLDIIIPTYKNKKGLRRTLNSIPSSPFVNVIVVDDCSDLDYSDILKEYPSLHFYQLEKNGGPGNARQYGIEHSNGTYITFLDTGDYFYEDGVETILENIQNNTYIKMYSFSYVYDDKNILADKIDNKTIGSVYKRSFIEMYNIHFCPEGSYANEDYGFSRACRLILEDLEKSYFSPMIKHIKTPVFYEHIDKNSLTKKNNDEFFYTKLPRGIIINGLHAIELARKAQVDNWTLIYEYSYIMAQEYYFFLSIANERPEFAAETWEIIRDFYQNHYRIYSKFTDESLRACFASIALPQIRTKQLKWKHYNTINILRFIKELEEFKFIPDRYLTFN